MDYQGKSQFQASLALLYSHRRFSDIEIKEFLNHLQTESWDQILLQDDVNESFNAFMTIFIYYFNITFPLKSVIYIIILKISG